MLATIARREPFPPSRAPEAWPRRRPRSGADGLSGIPLTTTAASSGRITGLAPTPVRHPHPPVEVAVRRDERPPDERPWPALLSEDDDAPDPWLEVERRRERAERLAREQRGR